MESKTKQQTKPNAKPNQNRYNNKSNQTKPRKHYILTVPFRLGNHSFWGGFGYVWQPITLYIAAWHCQPWMKTL